MKKLLINTVLFGMISYLALLVVVGSEPVQRRLFAEIRKALYEFGIDLEIESVEFSAFAPRIYLNRVVVRPVPDSQVSLKEPIAIDKVKLALEPLGLLSRKIVIGETVLFNPRIIVPRVDALYLQVEKLIRDKKALVVKGKGTFGVVFKRVGVVDAVFEIASSDPPFAVRSNSLTMFLEQSARGQQNITVQSKNLEFDRGKLGLKLNDVDIDIDATKSSIRFNKWVLKGNDVAMEVTGVSSLPIDRDTGTLQLKYDLGVSMGILKNIPELNAPDGNGRIRTVGTVEVKRGVYLGSGAFSFDQLVVAGFGLGTGNVLYEIDQSKVKISKAEISLRKGQLVSNGFEVDLSSRFPVKGEWLVKGVALEALLENLKSPNAPVYGELNGSLELGGYLAGPLDMGAVLKQQLTDFYVLDKIPLGRTHDNTIIEIESAKIDGKLNMSPKGVGVHALVAALDGELNLSGDIGLDGRLKLQGRGKGISLTKMKHIAEVSFAGKADVAAEMQITNGKFSLGGKLEVFDGEVAETVLGNVTGSAHYADKLLSFDQLKLSGIEPIRGSGYIDFRPRLNHYLFQVGLKRVAVDQVFSVFKRHELPFQKPKNGEVEGRVTIEGGHDEDGIQVTATGASRNFDWYGEQWVSSSFSVNYRRDRVRVPRLTLLKRSGALDVRGDFNGKNTVLSFSTSGLRLEELKTLGKAPLEGELVGGIRLEGDLTQPRGTGEVRLTKAAYRGTSIPDSTLRLKSENRNTEFLLTAAGNRLRARLLRNETNGNGELLLYFKQYNFAPLLSGLLKKDFSSIGAITATGDIAISGPFQDWKRLKGSGTITELSVDLRDGPMRNDGNIQLLMGEGEIKIDRFRLSGEENQLAGELKYVAVGKLHGSLDGKVDLLYLQPFIPGLEYGVGKVGVALRLSGTSDNFDLLGHASLEDGAFRITGLSDDFRNSRIQLTVSQDRINIDKLESTVGGGKVSVVGDVKINRFRSLIPNLMINCDRVTMNTRNFLVTKFTGDLYIRGDRTPYLLGGKAQLNEVRLMSFEVDDSLGTNDDSPLFKLDISGEARDKIFVTTEVMDAEYKGKLNLVGTTSRLGLLGGVDLVRGQILFKQTRFAMTSGTVRFDDTEAIVPHFNVAARALVRETRTTVPQDYEVTLQAIGTPKDYKLRLSSTPSLSDSELITLLILGVTTRNQDGNFVDLGSVIAGQTPFQSKLQNEFGVDVKMGTTATPGTGAPAGGSTSSSNSEPTQTLRPSVKIEKGIADKTKVSVSTTVGEDNAYQEFRIEHMLNDNFTANATAADRSRGSLNQDKVKSYGLDFRYHFTFE